MCIMNALATTGEREIHGGCTGRALGLWELDQFHADLLSKRLLYINALVTVGESNIREFEAIHRTAEGEF